MAKWATYMGIGLLGTAVTALAVNDGQLVVALSAFIGTALLQIVVLSHD